MLASLDVKIFTKNHFLPFTSKKIRFDFLPSSYYLFHIDKRWESFENEIKKNIEKKIIELSANNNVVVTSNYNGNKFFSSLKVNLLNKNKIYIYNNTSIDELIYLISKSHSVVSSHTGMIVHTAAAFNKNVIDIVKKDIFTELDRWIPFNINYQRVNIDNFTEYNF